MARASPLSPSSSLSRGLEVGPPICAFWESSKPPEPGQETAPQRKNARSAGSARWNSVNRASAYVAVDGLGDLVLGDRTHDLLDYLAVLEHQDGRNPADVVAARRIHRFVDVQLGDLDLSGIVVGNLRDRRRQHV